MTSNRRMQTASYATLSLVILAAGVVAFILIGGRKPAPASSEDEPPLPLVETVPVTLHQGLLDIDVNGLVVPLREIELAAEVAGRVTRKAENCQAGSYVTKDTLLIEVNNQDYHLQVERLNMELGQAGGSLDELDVEGESTEQLIELAREQWELRKRELKRHETLSPRKVVSQTQLDEVRSAELQARNSLVTLRNELRMIKTRRGRLEQAQQLVATQLQTAQLDLDRTKIYAPTDGMVVRDLVEEGDFVQPGTPLVTIEDVSAVEVKSSLRMDELNWLWQQAHSGQETAAEPSTAAVPPTAAAGLAYRFPHTPVTVRYELAGQTYTWDGQLTSYDGLGLDERTRTVPVRIVVPQPRSVRVVGGGDQRPAAGPPALMRGMYVTVSIHVTPGVELLAIPERSFRPGNRAWRVRDGKLDIVHVHVARFMPDTVLLYGKPGSLQAGDPIVVSPIAGPRTGMPVRERGEGLRVKG